MNTRFANFEDLKRSRKLKFFLDERGSLMAEGVDFGMTTHYGKYDAVQVFWPDLMVTQKKWHRRTVKYWIKVAISAPFKPKEDYFLNEDSKKWYENKFRNQYRSIKSESHCPPGTETPTVVWKGNDGLGYQYGVRFPYYDQIRVAAGTGFDEFALRESGGMLIDGATGQPI